MLVLGKRCVCTELSLSLLFCFSDLPCDPSCPEICRRSLASGITFLWLANILMNMSYFVYYYCFLFSFVCFSHLSLWPSLASLWIVLPHPPKNKIRGLRLHAWLLKRCRSQHLSVGFVCSVCSSLGLHLGTELSAHDTSSVAPEDLPLVPLCLPTPARHRRSLMT